MIDAVPMLASLPKVALRPGPGRVGHLRAAPDGYLAPAVREGVRVLVVDDTWTTGAHARSAAAALARVGAQVTGILVIGRAVEPAASTTASDWWRRATAESLRQRADERCRANGRA